MTTAIREFAHRARPLGGRALRGPVLILLLLCAWFSPATAEDRSKAAEHFALAEKAEARKDWRAAIAQYELAYDASPHASVQFNIAKNYERLGEARNAARHYELYLAGAGQAKDRAKVESRVATLRARPSKVQIIGRPLGAQVIVDDRRRGAAPITITLAAGTHVIALEQSGRQSRPQQVTLEYGDPMTVRLDLNVVPGTLMVFANVSGAEVKIDGKIAGYTPLTGQVPAGSYELLISKPGYQSNQRSVEVPAGGSRQVRVVLERIPGIEPVGTKASGGSSYLFGWGMGFDTSGGAGRYLFDLGYRTPGERLDLSLLLGAFGGSSGAGLGVDAKLYFTTGRVRPYAKVGFFSGNVGTAAGSDRITTVEAGAGLLVAGSARSVVRFTLDYFLELDVNYRLQEPGSDEQRLGIPIVGGLLFRYGGF